MYTYINETNKYEKEHRVPEDENYRNVTLFADVVKLQAKKENTLQVALTTSI